MMTGIGVHHRSESVFTFDRNDRSRWAGIRTSARTQSSTAVDLAVQAAATRLTIQWAGEPSIELTYAGPANDTLLQAVNVIGHRGASLDKRDRMNTLAAIGDAATFGADGVELDVTVPYVTTNGQKTPDVQAMRVHHPPEIRSELTGNDSDPLASIASLPTPADALRALRGARLRFLYLDMKLRWLHKTHRATIHESLRTIAQTVVSELSPAAGIDVMIGAEVSDAGGTADALQRLSADAGWPAVRLSWGLEITKGTSVSRALTYALSTPTNRAHPPVYLSFNLLRLAGGRGGLLGVWLRDLTPRDEEVFAKTRQAVIIWTVRSRGQLEGAIAAGMRLGAFTNGRNLGLITPQPHRLLYWLAASGGKLQAEPAMHKHAGTAP